MKRTLLVCRHDDGIRGMQARLLRILHSGGIACIAAAAFMLSACVDGYDEDPGFESSVKNATLEAVDADAIIVQSSTDGSSFTFTWPVVHGAGGYEVKLFNVSDPNQPQLVKADTVDACKATASREDDTNYTLTVRALSNAQLNNTAPDQPTSKSFTTFTPTFAAIHAEQYSDLKAYFDEHPLPEGNHEMLCFDLDGGANYTLSGNVDFGGHNVTIRCTNKSNHARLTLAQGAKLITFGSLYIKYLDIDCSQTNKTIIELSETPDDSLKTKIMYGGKESGYYFIMDPIVYQSCNIKKLGASIIADKAKYDVRSFTINDCIIEVDHTESATNITSDPVINLKTSSFITDLLVKNSTIYSKERINTAFLQYNGRPKEIDATSELQKITFTGTTLYQLSYGSNFRGDTRTQGQKTNYFTVEKCIIVDCGKKNFINSLLRQLSTSPTVSYYKNTYWWDGENVSEAQVCDGGDHSGTALETDPEFRDPANGDFTPLGAQQQAEKTGDPRWYQE